jgi:soluble lytic murein transglycosylase-like protein
MVAARHQVDAALVKAIIMAESSYNPKAVSRRGARGLMQLMPQTARAFGVEDSFNPLQNINGGVRYFKKLTTLFDGDIMLALAAYNAGVTRVKRYNGIPPCEETRSYVNLVLTYYGYYQE